MNVISISDVRRLGGKGAAVAFVSCAISLGVMILAFGLGPGSQHDSVAEQKSPPLKETPKKPVPTWNLALGNVVVIAPELGFGAKGPKDTAVEPAPLSTKIEGQLLPLRKLYRAESEKDPTLMGSLLLQLTIGPSGEVTRIKEIASRIEGGTFREAVLDEVAKWDFQDIAREGTIINCPLLFVREGMDITTLIKWEKTVGLLEERAALSRQNNRPIQESKTSVGGSRSETRNKKAEGSPSKQSRAKRSAGVLETRQAVPGLSI